MVNCESIFNNELLKEEKKVFEAVEKAIDNRDYMLYNAGAGAGKTYDLIQSLKYIINNYGNNLIAQNAKIMCITYTNVAVEEIKDRLGNTSLVDVSTIHERVWTLINPYQKQLVTIHKNKLESEIEILNLELNENSDFSRYKNLPIQLIDKVLKEMFIEENKEVFYDNYYSKTSEFKKELISKIPILGTDPVILKNIKLFKKWISLQYRINNYKNAIMEINECGTSVNITYNARINSDSLHNMRISHDTLLEYAEELISNEPLIRKIIIDKYPFILVDEYQDTNALVIAILNELYNESKKLKNPLFLGFYGDNIQSIYEGGLDLEAFDHQEINKINKHINRRSSEDIISIANMIRNDDIKQVSIYNKFKKNPVTFYNSDEKERIIDCHKELWEEDISDKNKIYCLELTNKLVAEKSGFYRIFDFFAKTPSYQGNGYLQLTTEVMSQDFKKLGNIQSMLISVLEFMNKISNPNTSLSELIPGNIEMNINEAEETINYFKSFNQHSLLEFIEELLDSNKTLSSISRLTLNKIKKSIFPDDVKNIEDFINLLLVELYHNNLEEDSEEEKAAIREFLQIDIAVFNSWYAYFIDKMNDEVIYYTLHSTKGREFENVIVFINSSFGANKSFMSDYLEYIGLSTKGIKNAVSKEKFEKIIAARNLLYVAVTRAKKNLTIVYSDELNENQKKRIKKIFGEIQTIN